MTKWQPIETAPRDGRWFVIAVRSGRGHTYETGRYDPMPWTNFVEVDDGLYRKEETIAYEWQGFNNFHAATHWMPLPAPPEEPAS